MNRIVKPILIVLAVIAALIVILLCSVVYILGYKVTYVDASQSPDGAYELKLQEIGEPGFPFGSATGRLILSGPDGRISMVKIEIANDGASISDSDWRVNWHDNRAVVMLMGEEQSDELVTLYFDGTYDSKRLETHWGKLQGTSSQEEPETETETEAEPTEYFDGQWVMEDGYLAIYNILSDDESGDDFEVNYGASESLTWCIVSEDENSVRYLVYDRKSENGLCGLYVYYESEKDDGGNWNKNDGTILDMYAYVYDTGEVIDSGKTGWDTAASQEYQDATGE